MKLISLVVPLLAALAFLAGCAPQTAQNPIVNYQVEPSVQPATFQPPAPVAVSMPDFDSNHMFAWEHFGTDPFAPNRTTAMIKRPEAFKALGIPAQCIAQAMQETERPGIDEHLNVGDRLLVMLSGGLVAHRNTVVKFPPVKHGIDYAAAVETWTFYCGGRAFKVGLPEICNNWSLYPLDPIVPALAQPFPVVPGPVENGCPAGFGTRFHVYPLRLLSQQRPELYAKAMQYVAEAGNRQKQGLGYEGYDFSRSLGGRLRHEWGVHSDVVIEVQVRYVDKAGRSTKELGVIHVEHGVGDFVFPDDPRTHITEYAFPGLAHRIVTEPTPVIHDLPNEWPDCLQNISVGVDE